MATNTALAAGPMPVLSRWIEAEDNLTGSTAHISAAMALDTNTTDNLVDVSNPEEQVDEDCCHALSDHDGWMEESALLQSDSRPPTSSTENLLSNSDRFSASITQEQQDSAKLAENQFQQQQIESFCRELLEKVEPHHYTIATHREPNQPLGLKLWELDEGGMLVMGIATGQDNSVFFADGATSPLHPVNGDVLIGVNDNSCTGSTKTLMDVKAMVDQSQDHLLTLTFRRPETKGTSATSSNKNQPNLSLAEGNVQRLTILNPNSLSFDLNDIAFVGNGDDTEVKEEADKLTGAVEEDPEESLTMDEVERSVSEPAVLLQIKSIEKTSWLSRSTCLAERQVVLQIQDIPCFAMSDSEVRALLQEELENDPATLTITTYKLPEMKSQNGRLRKALLGVGGSVLVGAGVVIMATPLHPIGHLMALGGGHVMTYGGIGVISSQFKGQKKSQDGGVENKVSTNPRTALRNRWSRFRRGRQPNFATNDNQDDEEPPLENDRMDRHEQLSSAEQVSAIDRIEAVSTRDPIESECENGTKSASVLQRARISWRNRRNQSGITTTPSSFDSLDDEIKKMEITLVAESKW